MKSKVKTIVGRIAGNLPIIAAAIAFGSLFAAKGMLVLGLKIALSLSILSILVTVVCALVSSGIIADIRAGRHARRGA